MSRRALTTTAIKANIACGDKEYGLRTTLPACCVSILGGGMDYIRWDKEGGIYKISKSAQGNGAVKVYTNGNAHRVIIPSQVAECMNVAADDKLKWLVACEGNKWEIHVEVEK